MKKRVLSLLLCIMLIVGMVPTTAFAAAGTWEVNLNVSESGDYKYNGQNTLALGFGVQSDDLKLQKAQSIVLAIDTEILEFLQFNTSDFSVEKYDPTTTNLAENTYAVKKAATNPLITWAVNVYCAKGTDGKTGYMSILPSLASGEDSVSTAKNIATVYLGFKSGKSISDLTSTSIRFINAAECATLNQSSAIEITNGAGTTQRAIMKDGSPDTLTGGFQVKWDGITPTEPPKPAYPGTIAAPTVKTNAGGKVELNAVTPSAGGTVKYGYSTSASTAPTTWQDSATFNGLHVGDTLFFYAKVVETPSYAEKVSDASAAVTVLDKQLTNLEITTEPTTKTYTHGDPFKTDGMKVKATYSDGSINADFTGYTVAYQTSGKGYLCKDNTKVTLKAGGKSVEVTGLTVDAKELTVTGLTAVDREYKPGYTLVNLTGSTLTGVVGSEDVSLHSTPTTGRIDNAGVGNGKDVAIDPLSLTGADAGNYTLTQPTGIKVNITQKNISGATISLGTQKTYNGSEQDVVISKVTVDGTDLTAGSDYTITSGDKATDVGDNTLVIEGKGNYKGTASAKWSLVAKDIGDASVSITFTPTSYGYTGSAINPSYTVKDNSRTLTVNNDYTANISDNTYVGTNTAKLTITGTGNYTGTKSANFTITAKDVSATRPDEAQTVIKNDGSFAAPTFDGVTGTLTYTYGGTTKTYDQIKSDLATKSAGDTATITYSYAANGNYTGTITGTINVTVVDVIFEVGGVTATVANALDIKADPTYGDDWSKIVKIKDGVIITAKVGTNTDTDQSHFTLKQTGKPGAGSQAYTLSYNGTIGGNTYNDVTVVSGTVNVAKKDVTITGLTASNKEYDGNTTATPAGTAVINGRVGSDDVAVTTGTAAFADKNVGTGKTVTFTGYSLSGTTAGNYNLKEQPASVTANITAKKVTVTGITATNRPYAKDNLEVALTGGTVSGIVSGDTVTIDLTNAKGTMTDANAGNGKAVTVTGVALGGANKGNYKLKEQPTGVTVDITKAAALTLADIPVSQKYTVTTGAKAIGTVMPADAGTLTYTKGAESKTGSVAIDSWAVDTTGKVTYTLSGGAAGNTVTLPVIIGSDNYENSTVNVVITLTAKENQAALKITGGETVVYGQTLQLGTSGGSGDGAVTYAVTNGTGQATIDASGKLTPVKVGTVKVKATKAEDANYNAITSAEVEITITRATPTGTPKYTAITTSGKTLADAGLTTTGSTLNPNAGTLVWVDNADNVLPDTTAVAANTTYKWLFTPTDTNYTTLTGSIELYHKSSSGGGGWYYTYYTIKATAGTNGSISPSGWTSVRDGRDQTFTITPDKGYAVAKVLVDGKSVGAVKSYTFKNVTKDHTIEAIFMKSNGNPQTGVFVMP